MPTTTTTTTMSERILDAASVLFYAEGLHAVSAEKILSEAGTTKVTFYRHYPSKVDLMVAYLDRESERARAGVAMARELAGGDDAEAFRLIAEGFGTETCSPGFRGCPFINAAAEYADPAHPVRLAVARHRRWLTQTIEEMLAGSGVDDVSLVADELLMLRDGAAVGGNLGDPTIVSRALYNAGRAIVAFHRRPGSRAR
jgi:AcrR family transcriptional regulator